MDPTKADAIAVASARDAQSITDASGRIRWVNPAFGDVTGHDMTDIAGRALSVILRDDRADRGGDSAMEAAMAAGVSFHDQRLLRRGDGGLYWAAVWVDPVRDETGALSGFSGVVRDISELRRSQRECVRLQSLIGELEQTAAMGWWELDPTEEAIRWSQGAFRLHDRDPAAERLSLQQALDHFPGDARQTLIEALEELRATRKPFSLELPMCTAAGRHVWAHITGHASYNDRSGDADRLFGVIQDITTRRDYERDIIQAREDLARADQAKTAFLANMSHELRTPLNGVMGMLQALAYGDISDVARDQAATAYESAASLAAILADILDMAKLETGQYQIRNSVFDPGVVAHEVGALFAAQAREKGLLLEVDVDPDTPRGVYGDGGRVRQVLTNLASNGLKFTDRGHVRICVRPEGRKLRFEIEDTGCGVAADQRDNLFNPFANGDGDARGQSGAGLGLAISRILVERMGGDIGYATDIQRGSTFWFDIELNAREDHERPDFAAIPNALPPATDAAPHANGATG